MEYELIRKNIKNMYIRVKPDGRVVVTAPRFASEKTVDSFVKSREAWVEKKRAEIAARPVARAYCQQDIDNLTSKVNCYLEKWCKITGFYPTKVRFKNMTSRWGSCNSKTRSINFAMQLVDTPDDFIEYVVLHELCHITVPNHGPEFKALLDRYMPDWKDRKKMVR